MPVCLLVKYNSIFPTAAAVEMGRNGKVDSSSHIAFLSQKISFCRVQGNLQLILCFLLREGQKYVIIQSHHMV